MKRLSLLTLLFLFALVSFACAGSVIGTGSITGGGTEVDWDLINEDFDDLTDWTDTSTGDADASIVTAGQLTLDSNNSAADNRRAGIYRDLAGGIPDEFTLWIDIEHDALGTLANEDYFNIDFRTADEGVWFSACTDGYFVYDQTTPAYTEVGTNLVKSGVDKEIQSWYWLVSFPTGTTGDGTADIYLKDSTHTSWTLVGDNIPCSNDQAGPNGKCYLLQQGYATNDMITQVYSVRMATGLYPPTDGGVVKATVTTQAVDAIGDDNATGHGTIVSTGGESASKRGICWADHATPTVSNSHAEDTGSFGTGAYSKLMTGLEPGMHYYARAYSYNSAGYAYGTVVEFDTDYTVPHILFYEDFEDELDTTADPYQDWAYNDEGTGSMELSSEQARAGTKSYKFSVTGSASARVRQEIILRKLINDGSFHFSIGDEYWVGFSIFLAEGYYSPDGGSTWGPKHHQYHETHDKPPTCDPEDDTSTVSQPIGIQMADSNWQVEFAWDSNQCTTDETANGLWTTLDPYEVGKWVDFVLHIVWDYDNDGLTKIWKDGVLIVDRSGGNCFNDVQGPYLQMGIYGWLEDAQVMTIYYDELRIGDENSSFAEVSP